jgi:PAS domain S-box-containing protein
MSTTTEFAQSNQLQTDLTIDRTNPFRILVVDDSADLRALFSTLLKRAGYETMSANSGAECLRIVAENAVDLVLLDVILPDMSGMEVCKQIKSDRPGILVLNISGMKTSASNAVEGLEGGADGYITKPVDARTLLAHVNALLRIKKSEEALRQASGHFRAVFESTVDAMFVVDDSSNCIDLNPAGCALFHLSKEEMIGRRFLDLLKGSLDWEDLECDWQDFLKQGHRRGEFTLHLFDGSTRAIEYDARAAFLTDRNLWVLRDIEARKRAEQAIQEAHDQLEVKVVQRTAELMAANAFLKQEIADRKRIDEARKEAEEKYRGIFENAIEGIFQSTPDGRFLSANPALARMFGYDSPEQLIKDRKNIEREHYVDPERRKIFKRLVEENDVVHGFELQAYRKDRSIIWTSENVHAVRDESGKLLYYEGIVEDVTLRKEVEKERLELLRRLVRAQEDEQRRISRELHDQMGQSLAALLLGLKSLKDSVHTEPARGQIERVQDITTRIANELHSLVRELRPTALDDLGLYTALSNYIEEWSEQSNIPVDFHSNGFLNQRLDSQLESTVYRIVQEALNNVLKHAKAQSVSIILERRANRVSVIVEDDGVGFDVEELMKTPARNRRFGLLGMQERVMLVGGTVNIESTPGVGTTVLVHIDTSRDIGGRTNE